jgi:hypothetical protein
MDKTRQTFWPSGMVFDGPHVSQGISYIPKRALKTAGRSVTLREGLLFQMRTLQLITIGIIATTGLLAEESKVEPQPQELAVHTIKPTLAATKSSPRTSDPSLTNFEAWSNLVTFTNSGGVVAPTYGTMLQLAIRTAGSSRSSRLTNDDYWVCT